MDIPELALALILCSGLYFQMWVAGNIDSSKIENGDIENINLIAKELFDFKK